MLLRKLVICTWAGFTVAAAGLVTGCGTSPRAEAPPVQNDSGPDDPETDPQDDGADDTSAKTYVGQVANTLALVCLVAENERIIAYVCDGDTGPQSLSQWYEGWLAPDGSFELESSAVYNWGDDWSDEWSSASYAGGGVLAGQIEEDKVTGWTYDAAGRNLTWLAKLADVSGPAGLYVGDDGEIVTSIVVLSEHLAQGVTRTRDTGVRATVASPAQIPADGRFAVTTNGQDLEVRAVVTPINLTDTRIVERVPTVRPPPGDRPDTGGLDDPGRIPAPENAIQIKFREGLTVRLPRGATEPVEQNRRALVSREAKALLAEVSAGTWSRSHLVEERTLDALRANGERRTGKKLPDLNLYFNLLLPANLDARVFVQRFRRLREVEWAWIMPDYYLADAPDYSASQGVNASNKMLPYQRYLDEAPVGVDAHYAWLWNADDEFRGDGTGVKVVDIESAFNADHVDLPEVTLGLTQDAAATAREVHHGTATLGVIAGLDDDLGVKGIAHGAQVSFVTTNTYGHQAAFIGAIGLDGLLLFSVTENALEAGDVIVLPIGIPGPNSPTDFVAVEWYKPSFDVIRIATANGIIVVEAAGNSDQDFDTSAYLDHPDAYHQPFLMNGTERVNDSGAIIVGAGASGADWSVYGTLTAHTRHNYSNYGGRVDLHAWGDAVVTAGSAEYKPENIIYADGANDVYHNNFNGTSSASAIMGGVVTAYQGFYKYWTGGTPLSSTSMRALLEYTGMPQVQAGSTLQKIGPMPNLRAAIDLFTANGEQGTAPDPELVQIGCELPPIYYPDGICADGLPAPHWSLPSGVYEADALDFLRPVYPDPYPASTVMQYTLDGSYPDGPYPCTQNCDYRLWTITFTNNCAAMSLYVDDLTEPLICRARLVNVAYCTEDGGAVSPAATAVYVPPGYIKLPEFDKPSTYDSNLSIHMRTGYTSDYPDGGAFVAYTLDGSTPVYYQNSAEGISSPVWTDYADDDGFTIGIFADYEPAVVTLKARNYLLIGGVYVPGEIVQWTYPRLD